MKFFVLFVTSLLLMISIGSAEWGSQANQVIVPTNAGAISWGTNLQSIMNYISTQSVWVTSGYLTTTNANLTLAKLSSDNSYNTSTTQKMYDASVYNAGTTNQVRLGTFYGFEANMTAASTFTGAASYVEVSNLTVATYNPQSQFDSVGRYTPTMRGYYRVGATLRGTGTTAIRAARTTNTYWNLTLYDGDTYTNGSSSGSTIIYLNGSTDFLAFEIASIRGVGITTSLVVNVEYIGK